MFYRKMTINCHCPCRLPSSLSGTIIRENRKYAYVSAGFSVFGNNKNRPVFKHWFMNQTFRMTIVDNCHTFKYLNISKSVMETDAWENHSRFTIISISIYLLSSVKSCMQLLFLLSRMWFSHWKMCFLFPFPWMWISHTLCTSIASFRMLLKSSLSFQGYWVPSWHCHALLKKNLIVVIISRKTRKKKLSGK